jgi:hypothetical protein
MFYTLTVKCPHCGCPCRWSVSAEVEPPPNARITIRCPIHGGTIPVAFRNFKPAEAPLPDAPIDHYPPRLPNPNASSRWSSPTQSDDPGRLPWWQFWKRW